MRNDLDQMITTDVEKLAPHLKDWVIAHLVTPRLINLYEGFDCKEKGDYLLITDHIGKEDSSYRVVYSEELQKFGLEMKLDDGTNVMMGLFGDFATTVQNM